MRVLVCALISAILASGRSEAAVADDMPHMGTTMTIDGREYGVYIEGDVNERTKSFNNDIKAHGIDGQIVSCSLLIDLPVGVADGNHSYGGYCKLVDHLGAKKLVTVCNDDMVGHFKLKQVDYIADHEWSEDALAKFVANNCFGG